MNATILALLNLHIPNWKESLFDPYSTNDNEIFELVFGYHCDRFDDFEWQPIFKFAAARTRAPRM